MRHNCPFCHTDFEGHPAARYCSYSCARKAYRHRQRYRYAESTSAPTSKEAANSDVNTKAQIEAELEHQRKEKARLDKMYAEGVDAVAEFVGKEKRDG